MSVVACLMALSEAMKTRIKVAQLTMTKKYFLSKNEIIEKEYNSIREICTNVLEAIKTFTLLMI